MSYLVVEISAVLSYVLETAILCENVVLTAIILAFTVVASLDSGSQKRKRC